VSAIVKTVPLLLEMRFCKGFLSLMWSAGRITIRSLLLVLRVAELSKIPGISSSCSQYYEGFGPREFVEGEQGGPIGRRGRLGGVLG
jgi:hypothetical protein